MTTETRYIIIAAATRTESAFALAISEGEAVAVQLDNLRRDPASYLQDGGVVWSTTDAKRAERAMFRARAPARRWRVPAHRVGFYQIEVPVQVTA